MNTRISAAALLDSTTITAAYAIVLVLSLVLASVIFGVRAYRRRLLRDAANAELSEAIWPSAEFPKANARLKTVLRKMKSPDQRAATITAELDQSRAMHGEAG
jgi:hypothetical protein